MVTSIVHTIISTNFQINHIRYKLLCFLGQGQKTPPVDNKIS